MGKRIAALILLWAGCAGREERMGQVESIVAGVAAVDWQARAEREEDFVGDDAWLRRMRARAALVARGTAVVPELVARLEDPSPWLRAFLLDTLAWIGDARSLPAAEEFSRRGHPRPVRGAAIRLLGRLGAQRRLRAILEEPLERVSPYETSTDWIHLQSEYALLVPPRPPRWDPSQWNAAQVGSPAPAVDGVRLGGRPIVLLFVLADW